MKHRRWDSETKITRREATRSWTLGVSPRHVSKCYFMQRRRGDWPGLRASLTRLQQSLPLMKRPSSLIPPLSKSARSKSVSTQFDGRSLRSFTAMEQINSFIMFPCSQAPPSKFLFSYQFILPNETLHFHESISNWCINNLHRVAVT